MEFAQMLPSVRLATAWLASTMAQASPKPGNADIRVRAQKCSYVAAIASINPF